MLGYLEIKTKPAVEPMTTADAKLHLFVASALTADDDMIAEWVTAARQYIERVTKRQMITATWLKKMPRFPAKSSFELLKAPLQSLTSITYTDTSGDQQTLDSSVFVVSKEYAAGAADDYAQPGIISLADGETWPSTLSQADSVVVEFLAGYGDSADDIPEGLRAVIKILLNHFYNNRSMDVVERDFILKTIMDPFRILRA